MSDLARPGEVDLESHDPAVVAAPVVEEQPAEEAAVEAVAEEAPAEEEAAPPPARKHTGAVAELIENRKALKEANLKLAAYESNPAIQRLTPEMQAAIMEGRVQVQPPAQTADLERERLSGMATELGLLKADGTPDLNQTRRVDKVIRASVASAVAPIEHRSLAGVAKGNVEAAVAFATTKYSPAVAAEIRAEYEAALNQPNGVKLISDAKFSTALWHSTIGKMFSEGKLAVAPPKPDAPAVVITEPTGRRAPATAVKLSPELQAVYKRGGLDPNATAAPPAVDSRGYMDLGD